MRFWRSSSGFEVDFILGNHTAIEVKAKRHVSEQDLKPLRMLAEEGAFERYVCVCQERRARMIDGILVVPFENFFRSLWGGRYT